MPTKGLTGTHHVLYITHYIFSLLHGNIQLVNKMNSWRRTRIRYHFKIVAIWNVGSDHTREEKSVQYSNRNGMELCFIIL